MRQKAPVEPARAPAPWVERKIPTPWWCALQIRRQAFPGRPWYGVGRICKVVLDTGQYGRPPRVNSNPMGGGGRRIIPATTGPATKEGPVVGAVRQCPAAGFAGLLWCRASLAGPDYLAVDSPYRARDQERDEQLRLRWFITKDFQRPGEWPRQIAGASRRG
ncbi:hypothetical protein [Hymenobacter sp. YC55]|uniref:hypothetical protein n=1 Tax=Hymenobacter sp. YC55 TaxID=3034019 RepID=UPI0023F786C9|nr:hypothetical protein [Hymenobacter sp. YC55]MDF7815764.1 hypothetical protein [Hymenobacter sp. YC55]